MRVLAVIALAACISKPPRPARDVDGNTGDGSGADGDAMHGLHWTTLLPSIDGRVSPRLTWDGTNQRALAFGGRNTSNAIVEDLWELQPGGTGWTQLDGGPVNSNVHFQPGFVYDVTLGPVVFGGVNGSGSTYLNELEFYNGTAWIPEGQNNAPPPRAGTAMLEVNGNMFVWGGYNSMSPLGLGDVYSNMDPPVTWLTRNVPDGSLTSRGMAVTWDDQNQRFLALTGTGDADELFSYEPSGVVSQLCTSCGSGGRQDASIVHMSGSNLTLLIGGTSGGVAVAGTMMLDGNHWVAFDPTMPPGRTQEGVTYDPINDRVIVFGGSESSACPMGCSDTYILAH